MGSYDFNIKMDNNKWEETDAAYIAGLFDGEGHVVYKQYQKQKDRRKHILLGR